jgi:hypothetical protein
MGTRLMLMQFWSTEQSRGSTSAVHQEGKAIARTCDATSGEFLGACIKLVIAVFHADEEGGP